MNFNPVSTLCTSFENPAFFKATCSNTTKSESSSAIKICPQLPIREIFHLYYKRVSGFMHDLSSFLEWGKQPRNPPAITSRGFPHAERYRAPGVKVGPGCPHPAASVASQSSWLLPFSSLAAQAFTAK